MLSRLIRIVNILIGVALAAALGLLYWLGFRPLPQTGGNLKAPIGGKATVTRDSLGVPHIRAASMEDALFVQGFVTAQDRMWQMDGLRRRAGGDLAEVVGPAALESDQESRRFRLRRVAEAHARMLLPADAAVLAAYARGVNYYLETHRGRLPLEFRLLNYHPRPWSMADTILAGLFLFRTLSSTWRGELQKSLLLSGGDAAKVDFLYPVRSGRELSPGSNAWVLAGSRTASGKPLLAGDPHLEWSQPSVWYMVHLQAPGLNVTGVSLPGVPCVIIGHNARIAWSVTNLHFDVQDFYIERMDPQSGVYLASGKPQQARLERDLIAVKGRRAAPFDLWVTRHGPVLRSEGGQALALRWTAAEPGGFRFPFPELNRAANWGEFRAALSAYPGPAQNFVYADVDGNIGYQAAGRLPIRKNYQGDGPVDGASGQFEWQGFIPFDELPQAYNPPSGMVVTANQNPFPADYPYRVGGNFSSPYRARQIQALLEARRGWRAGDMLAVQTDVYSAFSHFLARQVLEAYTRRKANNPSLEDALAVLRNWDGQMKAGAPAPFLATLVYQHLRKAVAESASPGKGSLYESQMASSVVERLLRERPAGWFDDYDQLLLQAFLDAVEEGRRMQGRDVKRWDYGAYNQIELAHPVAGRLPLVGRYFNFDRLPLSGSSTTVNQATRVLGPSMRMVVDLSDLDNSLQNIVTGQSGHRFSRHYGDQWDAYRSGRSFRMQFQRIEARRVLTLEP